MKPAAIRTMYETELYRQHTGFDDDTQFDSYFQQIAARQGKQVIGLESVDMQIALLFGNDDQKQEALSLVETVSHREEGLQEIETLNALYKVGGNRPLSENGSGTSRPAGHDPRGIRLHGGRA